MSKSRYHEYKEVFHRFIAFLQQYMAQHGLSCSQVACVITGDIFHQKNRIEAAGISLFYKLINGLTALVSNVFIIRGNHDFRQECPDEPDLIRTLLEFAPRNVHYLHTTNTYTYPSYQLQFGVLDVKDALNLTSTQGRRDKSEQVPFPQPDSEDNIKVALFHGPVLPCAVDLMAYDFCMLGDIHMQQVFNGAHQLQKPQRSAEEDVTLMQVFKRLDPGKPLVAYAGSMIQQDFSESLLGHGFLVWDTQDKSVECFHIHNTHGFVNCVGDNNSVSLRYGSSVGEISMEELMHQPWCPKTICLRGSQLHGPCLDTIRALSQQHGVTLLNTVCLSSTPTTPIQQEEAIPIEQICSPGQWISFIESQQAALPHDGWRAWLTLPQTSLSPPEGTSKDRADKISKKLDAYLQTTAAVARHSHMKILAMTWEWILCFRAKNSLDFEQLDGCISAINGKNGQGKTSFLECISIGLFGEGFPSRQCKTMPSSIINMYKPVDNDAYIQLTLDVGSGQHIIVRRTFTVSHDNPDKLQTSHKDTFVKDKQTALVLAKGKNAVDKWVEANVGSHDSFLISAMLTQNVDRDFFTLSPAEQKQMLDKALNIEANACMIDLLKETKLAIQSRLDALLLAQSKYHDSAQQRILQLQHECDTLKQELQAGLQDYQVITKPDHVVSYEEAQHTVQQQQHSGDEEVSISDLAQGILCCEQQLAAIKSTGIVVCNNRASTLPTKKSLDTALVDWVFMKRKWKSDRQVSSYDGHDDDDDDDEVQQQYEQLLASKPHQPTVLVPINEGDDEELAACTTEALQQQCDDIPVYNSKISLVSVARYKQLRAKHAGRLHEDVSTMLLSPAPKQARECLEAELQTLTETLEYDMEDYQSVREYYAGISREASACSRLRQEVANTEKSLKQYETLPFNAQCQACQQTPWRRQFVKTQETLASLSQQLGHADQKRQECHELITQLAIMERCMDFQIQLNTADAYEIAELQLMHRTVIMSILWQRWLDAFERVKRNVAGKDNKEYARDALQHGSIEHNEAVILAHHADISTKLHGLKRVRLHKAAKASLQFYDASAKQKQCMQHQASLATIEAELVGLHAAVKDRECLLEQQRLLEDKVRTIATVIQLLQQYQLWIYQQHVLPRICFYVNNLLDVMGLAPELRLRCRISASNTALEWFLGQPPLEKASGYQRFLCSLGMRIALSRVGASQILNRQLFLDEGFVACDIDNLKRVPAFLRKLLAVYDAIILVTHLEELKEAVDKTLSVVYSFKA